MQKFAMFFSYSPETWAKMMAKPEDRTSAVSAAVEGVGGKLDSLYFMMGEKDGFVLFSVPDTGTAAALALAVNSTGAFDSVQTTQLIDAVDLPGVLRVAGNARGTYQRPGA
ncbi:GYD domain-containing protein [Actinomycetospora endophytica]|uniref:GYD domain-containing protein n=1 Tax=Actinomycetospora endophytica TaxID=2291215 RepID=A0ABS8P4D1_9PSEU|nr:GYD domain-containing protein [Actinomycetospora endophytica]MCD2193086.1 GYD domain-containing protein [Actinomycetospora endophytica]